MGTVADASTRRARILAHAAFDALWEGDDAPMVKCARFPELIRAKGSRPFAPTPRKLAYLWMGLALDLGKDDAHIALFSEAQCKALVEACASPTFEVRWVDAWNQKYVRIGAEWFLTDACLLADAGAETGDDFIVWHRTKKRIFYDTRTYRPLPLSVDPDETELAHSDSVT